MPTIQVVSIGQESEGSLSIGDRLIAIENDNTSQWPIERGHYRNLYCSYHKHINY